MSVSRWLRIELRRDILYVTLEPLAEKNSWAARVANWQATLGPGFLPKYPATIPNVNVAIVYAETAETVDATKFPGLMRQWSNHGYGVTVTRITTTSDPDADARDNPVPEPCGNNPLCKAGDAIQSVTGPLTLVLVLAIVAVGLYVAAPWLRRSE